MKRTHQITVFSTQNADVDLRNVRKQINAHVKKALAHKTLTDTWGYDGRAAKLLADGSAISADLTFKRYGKSANTEDLERCLLAVLAQNGWTTQPETEGALNINTQLGGAQQAAEPVQAAEEAVAVELAPINIERGNFFDHIYERDSQIAILHSSIKAAVESGFQSRFHTILSGPPGSGKTEILRAVRQMIGEGYVLTLDGPSTTKAGAERHLMNVQTIQPFVLIEEIEKMHPAHMQWLLGLLDERGEVRRTNARDGHVQRDAKVLCIATVNDTVKFRSFMHGALASRFSHEIYCPRPDGDVLTSIAVREVTKVGGNLDWVKPAVLYCTVVENTYDPRRIISVCLSGRDALLDGTYMRALMENRELQAAANSLAGSPK